MFYAVLKFVHVLAVIMFVGNITVGVFWKQFADATKDPRIMAHTLRGIIMADRIFTIPGVILLVLAGLGTAGVGHWSILGTGWILWSIGLFIISGIAFGSIVRSQRQMAAVAQAAADGGALDTNQYEGASRIWNIAGMVALVAPLIAVAFMIAKPNLPAFHP